MTSLPWRKERALTTTRLKPGIADEVEKLNCLDDIWNYQVVPLLKEYFYGQVDLLRQVLPSFFSQDDGGQPQSGSGLVALHGEDLVAVLNKL